ncbi:DNA-binding protein [Thalassococcus profundi]|uniref:DNA-binding protein n=1 Tax=Thalassococcus profundi TaxID=2282382 RepID=A0A369TFQ8_9RHOB|nr:helix-turn-helix domain-containing protein [Thalassococcus profundi]RDD64189.1 DNA-binding protein [Thalassococcus profundi]
MTHDALCFTTNELAARWKVSIRTLERWRAERYGPAWITIGGSIRYRIPDVLAWEAAHTTRP